MQRKYEINMEINRKLEHLTEEQIEEVITMYKDKSIRLSNIISKYNIDDAFKVTSLKTFMNNKEENDTKEEVIEKTDTQVKQQSLDDFIEDFKL